MLLSWNIVPIINENDTVVVDELKFGDNDNLSAMVTNLAESHLLINLTDIDGFFDMDPRTNKDARLISRIEKVSRGVMRYANSIPGFLGTGGMASKIAAIRMAADAGCRTVLAHGRARLVVPRIVAGEEIGTLFLPKRRLSNRKRWIMNSRAEGTIQIDAGAADALNHRRSLLLVGITSVEGTFHAGDVVRIGSTAKGVSSVSSAKLGEFLQEQQSEQSKGNTGVQKTKRKAIVHVNDLVVLKE